MMIFTDRELESLTSLRANWERLYRDELLRLLNETDNADVCDGLRDRAGLAPISGVAASDPPGKMSLMRFAGIHAVFNGRLQSQPFAERLK